MATKAKPGPGKAQKKGRSSGGRTTESGRTTPSGRTTKPSRYTPPVPKNVKTSPRWMGLVIIGFFLLGVLIVILNYAGLLPGGVNNLWLVAAIGAIFVGLIMATRYH